jgi:hypothetical protein
VPPKAYPKIAEYTSRSISKYPLPQLTSFRKKFSHLLTDSSHIVEWQPIQGYWKEFSLHMLQVVAM